jgi:N-acyl-L-homoserine lactone synthetase
MAAILVKDVPDELRNLFKALCAEQGKPMREGIIELMREAVDSKRKPRR